MTSALERVLVAHAAHCFKSQEYLSAHWQSYGYRFEPSYDEACRESDQFIRILEDTGAVVDILPEERSAGLDSLYVHDPVVTCGPGMLSGRMGKPLRKGEPAATGQTLSDLGFDVSGLPSESALIEGGDVVWLRPDWVAVGEGFRTNAEGIDALRTFCGDTVAEVEAVPLPYWRGSSDVLHLMSLVSPLNPSQLLVHSPLMPVPFRQKLEREGFELIECPAEDYDSLGCNVLALNEKTCLIEMSNVATQRLLRSRGFDVVTYEGRHISQAGEGGPTCLTRPLKRA